MTERGKQLHATAIVSPSDSPVGGGDERSESLIVAGGVLLVLRASDADREATADRLRQHHIDGRSASGSGRVEGAARS